MKCCDLFKMSTMLPLRGDEMSSRKADELKVTVLTQDSRPEKNDIVCLILPAHRRP